MKEKVYEKYMNILKFKDKFFEYFFWMILINFCVFGISSLIIFLFNNFKKESINLIVSTTKFIWLIGLCIIIILFLVLLLQISFIKKDMKSLGYNVFNYCKKLKVSIPPEQIIIDKNGDISSFENFRYFLKVEQFGKTIFLEITENIFNQITEDFLSHLVINNNDFKYLSKEDLMYVKSLS